MPNNVSMTVSNGASWSQGCMLVEHSSIRKDNLRSSRAPDSCAPFPSPAGCVHHKNRMYLCRGSSGRIDVHHSWREGRLSTVSRHSGLLLILESCPSFLNHLLHVPDPSRHSVLAFVDDDRGRRKWHVGIVKGVAEILHRDAIWLWFRDGGGDPKLV